MQDRAHPVAIAVAELVQNQPVGWVHRDPELPVLPRDGVAVDVESHALGLGDGQGLRRIAEFRLARRIVSAGFGRQRDVAVVFQVGDSTRGQIHVRDQALHGTRIAVVRPVLPNEADATVGSVAGRDVRVRVAARRPGIDLDVLEVLDAAPSHGRLPVRILLCDPDRVDHVGEADGCLSLGDARHHHVVGI